MVGSMIENYKVVSILGEGGMGVVYKALDTKLERFVALKILNAQAASTPQFIERFKREARNQAKLTHPNIVPVYGFVEEHGTLGIVMEYVEGETLEKMILRKKRLDVGDTLNYMKQLLAGVGYAHTKGFIHRDIKPSNVIINHEGTVKIMDFGISKSMFEKGITKTGTKIGTILYMSPEQIRAEEPTRQSDIYSIGITLYEMLVGATPFDFGTEYEIMEAHLKKNPGRVSLNLDSIPPEMDKIVLKALEKNQSKRYASCDDFSDEIELLFAKVNKSKPVLKKEPKREGENFGYKFRATLILLSAIIVFTLLGWYLVNKISEFWPSLRPKSNTTDTTAGVTQNPAYEEKSNWEKLTTSSSANLNSIFFLDDQNGYAVGDGGVFLTTHDAGSTWTAAASADSGKLNDVSFRNDSIGFAVGENGGIFLTLDRGANWRKINAGVSETLFRITFTADNAAFIIGSRGLILRSNDNGISWSRLNSPVQELLYNIYFVNSSVGFIVGWKGTILKTNDGGNSWQIAPSVSESYIKDVHFVSDQKGYICGAEGSIYMTVDQGATWQKQETGSSLGGLSAIRFSDAEHGISTSNKGEILQTQDGGSHWQIYANGNYFSLNRVCKTSSGGMYICGAGGLVLKR